MTDLDNLQSMHLASNGVCPRSRWRTSSSCSRFFNSFKSDGNSGVFSTLDDSSSSKSAGMGWSSMSSSCGGYSSSKALKNSSSPNRTLACIFGLCFNALGKYLIAIESVGEARLLDSLSTCIVSCEPSESISMSAGMSTALFLRLA